MARCRRVAGYAFVDEGQRLAAQRALQQGGLDVDDAVAEPRFITGLAIVQLVRMQHEAVARQAVARALAVVETMQARQRTTDGIGVVPVRSESVTGEVGLQSLEPPRFVRAPDPILVVHVRRVIVRRPSFRC